MKGKGARSLTEGASRFKFFTKIKVLVLMMSALS